MLTLLRYLSDCVGCDSLIKKVYLALGDDQIFKYQVCNFRKIILNCYIPVEALLSW